MNADHATAGRATRGFGLALLLAALATIGHVQFGQDLRDALPVAALYLAVVLATLAGGARTGLIALAATSALFWYWPGLAAAGDTGAYATAFYAAMALVLLWLAATARRLRRTAHTQKIHLQAVLGSIDDGVLAIDVSRRVRYLNPAAERLLGVDREQAQRQPLAQLLAGLPEDAFQSEATASGGSGSRSHSRFHVDLAGQGGQRLIADIVALRGPRQALDGHLLFLRPVGEERYALSDRRLRAVFDTDLWGICFADLHSGRWLANRGFQRLLPATADAARAPRSLQALGIPAALLDNLRRDGAFAPTEVRAPEHEDHGWMLLAGEALDGDDVALLALDIGERKRSDAALRAQRQLMRSLIDRLPALVAYVDSERRYRLFNRDYARWFPRASLLNARLDAIHPREDLEPYQDLLDRAFAGEAVRFPTELRRRGVRHHFDVQLVPYRPDGAAVEGVVIHAMDVTERIESAQRLQASERRFRSLALAWAGIVWYADRDGHMTDAPGWDELTGQTPAQYRGEGWLQAVAEDDRARVRAIWTEAMRGDPVDMVDLEFRVLTPHGEARYVAMRAVPVEDGNGRVVEWIGGIRDIHERRLFEIQLRNAEAEQHALLDNLPKMVWIAEPDGAIRYQNRRWYEYTGLSGEENWQRITHPDDLEIGLRAWNEAIRSGKPLNVELRFRSASGEYRWHVVRGQPLFDTHGQLRCWYGASSDIEDQKRALETLAAANQRISRFLAVLSHELRNPLSGVSAASDVLARADASADQRQRALQTLARQNRHLQRMVEDLLDISRVTQGDLELRREPVELGLLLEEVRQDNLARAESEGVVLQSVRAPMPVWVDGDRARLRQVFDNLVSNAIKASDPGQAIALECRDQDARAQVQIRDHGQGLSQDMALKLFEPFVQTPDWRSRGLGLGLNIVKTLVERHGGGVTVRSDGLGAGSCFCVDLPAIAAPASIAVPSPAATAQTTRGASGAILIVDDERDTAEALRVLLELEGHRTEVAGDAEQALARWQGQAFDVVLCDLELPGPLTGYDVARALASHPSAPYLIAYSGYGQPEDRERTRAAGFHEHVVKPAALEELLAALHRGQRARQAGVALDA